MSTWNEADHPREPSGTRIGGRFTANPGSGYSLSRAAKLERDKGGRPGFNGAMMELFEKVSKPDGGFTYQVVSDKSPKEGFCVSPFPDRSAAFSMSEFKLADMVRYVQRNKDMLRREGHFLGAWHDPAGGKIFLDVSVVKRTRGEAARVARERDQIAYFDLGAMKSVTVNANATSGGAA